MEGQAVLCQNSGFKFWFHLGLTMHPWKNYLFLVICKVEVSKVMPYPPVTGRTTPADKTGKNFISHRMSYAYSFSFLIGTSIRMGKRQLWFHLDRLSVSI